MATDKEKVEKEKKKMQAKAKPAEEVESADYDPEANAAESDTDDEVRSKDLVVGADPDSDEQPTMSEELEAYQEEADLDTDTFEGVTDSVPGAVTELTPEAEDADEAPMIPNFGGFAQLADTDTVADLGAKPGTKVFVVSAGPQELVEGSDIFNPRTRLVEDADVVVRTRDARSEMLTVKVEDLEPLTTGESKG